MRRLLAAVVAILVCGGNCASADEANKHEDGWQQPKLPMIKLAPRDWYPPEARFGNMQGRVLVAFDITAAGVAKDISIIWAEQDVFGKATVSMLASARFAVPADWDATGAWRRWRVGVVYRLASPAPPEKQSDQFAIPVERIYITGSSIPGAYRKR